MSKRKITIDQSGIRVQDKNESLFIDSGQLVHFKHLRHHYHGFIDELSAIMYGRTLEAEKDEPKE